MGGCRCTFRSCTVNTLNFPGMHFFHYPVKHEKRLAEWMKYSNYEKLRELSPAQARNKVVCALHFRDECFMNFKKDRLNPQAIPTLDRLRNGLVLDYSLSANPKPMTVPPTTQKHLIPPKGYLPLGLPEDYFTGGSTNVEMLDDEDEEFTEPLVKRSKTIRTAGAPKILNKGVCSAPSSPVERHLEDEESYETYEDELGLMLSESDKLSTETLSTAVVGADGVINLNEVEFMPLEKECADEGTVISRDVYDQTVDAFESELTELKVKCDQKLFEAEKELEQLKAELAEAKEEVKSALARAESANSRTIEFQKRLEASEAANKKLSIAAVPPKPKSTGTGFGQLTKPQLFNGIKKYLTTSMTALVRMEMFGGSERQWKPDEKQVSVELLRLGENVYDYFNDEWRFRLPPKKHVKEWNHQAADEDEEDL